ncbi:MAG: leucine-rich repeat domain-containing protein [Bacteroidales bacterium]|nr:leucine-rich repeat domain-containing protein [Bacteroidales bacterium]
MKGKIVKRGVISGYKYTISDDHVVTIKGAGELENGREPLKFRFPAENVVIDDGITSIGNMVFWWQNLRTIQIPDTVTKIESSAFGRCYNLKAPSLPDSITELGRGVFAECHGFDKIVLPRNLKVLPLGTFSSCRNLEEVELSNIERIEEHAFEACRSLKRIILPETVNYVGKEAFKDCESLETVVFTSNGCKIEDNIFEGCQAMKRVVLPASYAYRNLGNLWGRDYTSLVQDIVEFLPSPSDTPFPMEAIESFYKNHKDNSTECIRELSQAEKSLKLNESTTIWGFATLTKVYEYPNDCNARFTVRFEEFSETFEDDWFFDGSLKAFLRKQFLSKPVDRFDGLTNNYTRFMYRWHQKAPDLRYDKNPQYLQDCRLLGEEILTPYYSLDKNAKIVRLEEPTEIVDISDAVDAFMKLIGNEQGYIGTIVDKMINEFGPVKTCRLLGHLITAGNVFYDEWEYGGETHGGWRYMNN